MALWSNTDEATSAPKSRPAGGLGVSANGQQMYGNTQTSAFVTDVKLGVFGVAPNETTGVGNVASITIVEAGSGFTARPTVTITGANTTTATATANGKVVSATIYQPGTGYAVGNTFTATGGTGTSAVLTITTVNAQGNVTGISITTAGDYTALPTLLINPFTSNTGSGTGFTANLSIGVGSTQVTNKGQDYNSATVSYLVGGAGGSGTLLTINLDGQDGTNRGGHAGWVLRKEGTGGRAGRVHIETLVAMGSMTGDGDDDTQFGE
jgi:hypothetical protein